MTSISKIGSSHGGSEYDFTEADFADIAQYAGTKFGIHLPETKMPLVYSRLVKRLRHLGLSSFAAYRDYLNEPSSKAEQMEFLSSLTTNVTHFFREGHHFKTLREQVLPLLIEKARKGKRVRLWSAGCSTGMEAYSIAITLLDLCPEAAKLDIKILATDIDPVVVKTGAMGMYDVIDLEPLDTVQWKKYLETSDELSGKKKMSEAARDLVSFGVLNLMDPLPFTGPFDVIFCRNVAIYFTQETQSMVWEKLTRVLGDEGYLFIGHSERLSGPAKEQLHSAGITTYSKKS